MSKVVRPSWDEYFLCLAKTVSLRAEDLFIRHGSVIIENNSKHIIGTGYNGLIRNTKLDIDLSDRDGRRPYMIHAEENAIMNCSLNPLRGFDCTIYVTGEPCANCLQRIINFGIKRLVYVDGIAYANQELERKIKENIIKSTNLQIEKISKDNFWLEKLTVAQ